MNTWNGGTAELATHILLLVSVYLQLIKKVNSLDDLVLLIPVFGFI
jgi:hypothetical protein